MDCDHLGTLGAYGQLAILGACCGACCSTTTLVFHHGRPVGTVVSANLDPRSGSISWAYCYGLESYPRSYEFVMAILYQSTLSEIRSDPQTCSSDLLPGSDPCNRSILLVKELLQSLLAHIDARPAPHTHTQLNFTHDAEGRAMDEVSAMED
jgi:hypothetical protein